MSMVERISSLLTGEGRTGEPAGTIHVVDPSPLNWLYITYNTVEELVRTDTDGAIVPAAMKSYAWKDDGHTLEVELRPGNRFQDGEALTARSVKRGFDESIRWAAPHPPGTHFNPLPAPTSTPSRARVARSRASTPCASACPRRTASCSGSCARTTS